MEKLTRPRLERSTCRHWLLSEADRERWMKGTREEREMIIRVDDLPREARAVWDSATTKEEKERILENYEKIKWASEQELDFADWGEIDTSTLQWEHLLVEHGIEPVEK